MLINEEVRAKKIGDTKFRTSLLEKELRKRGLAAVISHPTNGGDELW
jgi:hypothetical protein